MTVTINWCPFYRFFPVFIIWNICTLFQSSWTLPYSLKRRMDLPIYLIKRPLRLELLVWLHCCFSNYGSFLKLSFIFFFLFKWNISFWKVHIFLPLFEFYSKSTGTTAYLFLAVNHTNIKLMQVLIYCNILLYCCSFLY